MAIINTIHVFGRLKRQLIDKNISLTNIIQEIVGSPAKSLNLIFNRREEELFTIAKYLNDQNIENRLAGIDDLEKFSQKYPQYHGQIIRILSYFVQKHSIDLNSLPKIPTDIQFALTVIGRRNINHDGEEEQLDLSYGDMRGANLSEANLKSSNLYHVNLAGANLTGANLSGAILTTANLAGANLAGANLSGAILSAANLTGANLTGANLQRANLYLANLQGATLNDVMLQGANLREAKWDI